MIARKKTVELTVTVNVPAWMTRREAAREVRTNINYGSAYLTSNPRYPFNTLEPGDVKAKSVKLKDDK